jgi:hypothetical protein
MKALSATAEQIREAHRRAPKFNAPPPPKPHKTWVAAVRARLATGPHTKRDLVQAFNVPEQVIGAALKNLQAHTDVEITKNQGRMGPKNVHLYRLRS